MQQTFVTTHAEDDAIERALRPLSIDDLYVTVRVYNALKAVGLTNAYDVYLKWVESHYGTWFLRLPNFGRKSRAALCEALDYAIRGGCGFNINEARKRDYLDAALAAWHKSPDEPERDRMRTAIKAALIRVEETLHTGVKVGNERVVPMMREKDSHEAAVADEPTSAHPSVVN